MGANFLLWLSYEIFVQIKIGIHHIFSLDLSDFYIFFSVFNSIPSKFYKKWVEKTKCDNIVTIRVRGIGFKYSTLIRGRGFGGLESDGDY